MVVDATNDYAHVSILVMINLKRRAFFLAGTRKVAEVTITKVDERVKQRAKHWIRPPYALDELDFLTTCTRCGECIDACPHQVIFPLSSRLGASVTKTPALDLLNKSCYLCADWPCVTTCKPGALKFPQEIQKSSPDTEDTIPRIALASINTQSCLPYNGPECGACASSCPIPDALSWCSQKPSINPEYCIGCGLCREACITDPKAIEIRSLYSDTEQNES